MDLTVGIVRILRSNGTTCGTGFVVSDKSLIVTCAHVIESSGAGPDSEVTVCFKSSRDHPIFEEKRTAKVIAEWWRARATEDVAVLRLIDDPLQKEDKALPGWVAPLPLGSSEGVTGHDFLAFGFPSINLEDGMRGAGRIVGEITLQGIQVLQISSKEVTPGFSGGPIFDVSTRRVVGMVRKVATADGFARFAETAFLTPTKALSAICPDLQPVNICPYRSLEAFTKDDAEFFFGRDKVVDKIVMRLRQNPRFLLVLGASGSGKSSLIQAGLVSQLRRGTVAGSENWGVIVTRPTNSPFTELFTQGFVEPDKSLKKSVDDWLKRHPEHTRLVLILDQFEELFVACPEGLRQTFLVQLTETLQSSTEITVILGMRDEFYSLLNQQAPTVAEWANGHTENVLTSIDETDFTDIVCQPAQAVGLQFEDGLVETIVDDALSCGSLPYFKMGQSTVLPLLEFALRQLWERREHGTLTRKAYSLIGGVSGGLTQWADRTFYSLPEVQRPLARRILTRLVHVGSSDDEQHRIPDSRKPVLLDDLCQPENEREAIHDVVQRLVNARLLVTTRDIQSQREKVELIHDRLLSGWGLLQQWLQEDRNFLLWSQEIEKRAQAWIKSGLEESSEANETSLQIKN